MGYVMLLDSGDLNTVVWNLIFGFLIMMIYIQGLIIFMEKAVTSGKLSSDLSRKVIHIAAGSFIWVWLFMDPSDDWSYGFNIVVPLLFFLTFLAKGFTLPADTDDKDVIAMTRTGNPRELLKGPLYFTIIMMIAGTLLFGSYAGMLMMAIVGWGDGLAPYIGQRWGNRKYKTLGREKSIEGSIGVLIFGIFGSIIFLILLGIIGDDSNADKAVLADPNADLMLIIIVIVLLGIVAMVVEAMSPADIDNLLIPASTIIVLAIIDILLGDTFFLVWRIGGETFSIN